MTTETLWPAYATPDDLALLSRAARLWPNRRAVAVLPDSTRWTEPSFRTFGELLADVHRTANLLHDLGVRRRSTTKHNATA